MNWATSPPFGRCRIRSALQHAVSGRPAQVCSPRCRVSRPDDAGGAMHPLLREVDWDRQEEDAVELLRALVRFDTSNPPGDEAGCIDFLAEQVREAGLEPEVLSPAPRRANLVVRLPASGGRDLPPLLLNGHVDVVPAEEGRWRHPPFAGEVHDGAIWGRGTVDMKQMVAMSVAVVRLLAQLGAPLRRDLVLAAVADEEAGCAMGSAFLVDQHPDKVRAGFALGEVGGFARLLAEGGAGAGLDGVLVDQEG